jgi:hypothetical protein
MFLDTRLYGHFSCFGIRDSYPNFVRTFQLLPVKCQFMKIMSMYGKKRDNLNDVISSCITHIVMRRLLTRAA